MSDEKCQPINQQVIERMDSHRRQLLKFVLGSAVAYTVPAIASFSMEGLGIGTAEAGLPPDPDSSATNMPRPPNMPR